MTAEIKSVILAAVGGQGGGVLTEWIVTAAQLSGYEAQSISMPGMSQRGGATNLYLEIAIPGLAAGSDEVVFSQYPFPGQVDVVVSQEYLELGRVLQAGYTSERSTVVGSSHRLFAITEKLPLWGGRTEAEALTELGRAFSGNFVVFDALDVARQHGMDELAVNAILLGALAASHALPIARDTYERAVRDTEIGVEANLAAFRIGYDFVESGGHLVSREKRELAPVDLVQANASRLRHAERAGYLELIARADEKYPAELQDVLAEALYQLTDYQDAAYAARLLDYLDDVRALEPAGRSELSRQFVKHITPLLTYEDVIRVASFKTDPERFEKIRRDFNVKQGDVYVVHDFFDPDLEELYGILPNGLVKLFARPQEHHENGAEKQTTLPFKANVHSVTGAFPMWLLKRFRSWRLRSFRYAHEMRFVDEYRTWVAEFAPIDYNLACLVARTGQMVKGYGRVRRRTRWATRRYMDEIVRPATEMERELTVGYPLTLQLATEARRLLGIDERGVHLALALASGVFATWRLRGYPAALAEVEASMGAPVGPPR
jgi:indolepyruvate ferredoxin oxidoreductase beta subunit